MKRRTRRNPTRSARRLSAKKAATDRRVATALAKYLRAQNPGVKLAGARVQKLKGGVLKITPVKMNSGERYWYVMTNQGRHGPFDTRKEAADYARYIRNYENRSAWVAGGYQK